MFEFMKARLERGGYTLEDARKRIAYLVADWQITPEQAEALRALADEKADPVPVSERLEALERKSTNTMLAVTQLYEMQIGGA